MNDESVDASDALAAKLAAEFPEPETQGGKSKRPLVIVAIVAVVLLFLGVRRLRAKREAPLGGGVTDISV